MQRQRIASLLLMIALIAGAPALAAEPAAGGAAQQGIGRYQVLVEGMT